MLTYPTHRPAQPREGRPRRGRDGRRWTDAALLEALRRYVAEFGPLPGGGRYQEAVRDRPDLPRRGLVEWRFGSLRAAGLAAGVPLDLHRRDWTPDEIDRLHELVGVLPTLKDVARRLGRGHRAVANKAHELSLTASAAQGCYTAMEVADWLHYGEHTVCDAITAGVVPGAYRAGCSWQIRAGSLLAAEGILYRALADLDPDVRRLIELDALTLNPSVRARIRAWQAYREPGRWYPWRGGQIRAWWRAHQRNGRAGRPDHETADPARAL